MSTFIPGWYLIYTKPRQERKVVGSLAGLGIDHFLPTIKTVSQRSDRKKTIENPMFPSYVFVHPNTVNELFAGQDLDGAVSYVKFGKRKAILAPEVIDNVKIIAANAKNIEISYDHFSPGEKLIIQKGALAGLQCEMISYKNKNLALVRIELLQRNIIVDVEAGHLNAQLSVKDMTCKTY
ncbi:UpxY family transcription antiterminator [Chitinophaga varians]|uniref:UpxY family transcription antiterminator n=1 Tax=Chitinophaga varians TaxID=2202339 RepID=A0A847RZS0_9BACT|nr:UpxY family transcription antiterminator [Chitinophaga varians]NLR68622.1 UpxY family transcription antiterminator [Chitinophaga varians]